MNPIMKPGTDNKALYELRDELKDLNKTIKESNRETKKFSFVIMALTFVQIFIAIIQFLFSAQTSNYRWLGLLWAVILAGFIIVVFKIVDKRIEKK